MKTLNLTRRSFGKMSLGVGATLLAAPAIAQSKQVSAIVSAVYKPAFDAFIVPRMRDQYGIQVSSSPLLSAESLARAIAQKDKPSIDIFSLDQGPWLQGRDLGLWDKFNTSIVTNMADIPKAYQDPDGLGSAMIANLTVMVYDEAAVTKANIPAPTSFFDLWAPEYKNRVSIPQFTNTFAFATLARTTQLVGGDPSVSFDPGFDKVKEMKPNIRTFMGPLGQVVQMFQQKEIWLCFVPQFSAAQSAAAGLPIKWVVPKEGGVAMSSYIAMPKNAAKPEEAQLLANMMLSPEWQAYMAEKAAMGPVNSKTQLPDAVAKTFPSAQDMANAGQVPWAQYNAQRTQLAERWQREIQA